MTRETGEGLAVPSKGGFPQGIVQAKFTICARAPDKEDLLPPLSFCQGRKQVEFGEDIVRDYRLPARLKSCSNSSIISSSLPLVIPSGRQAWR